MSLIKHTAEERIYTFFKKYCTASRDTCDSIAKVLAESEVNPSSTQGAFSYTLIGTHSVIQFRAQISPLDIQMLQLARSIHGKLVPNITDCSGLYNDFKATIYRMERLLGENYALLYSENLNLARMENQKNILKGFAMFFGQAWNHPQQVTASTMENTRTAYQHKIDQLTQSLPVRYANLLTNCKDGLDYVFNGQIPWTLTHGDLCDTNILVNQDTGELTGIVDWAECSVVPFGFSLWGLETFLGFMDISNRRWSYYKDRKQLEAVFWVSLESYIGPLNPDQRRGIHTARLLGLFCRHAFKFNGVEEVPKDETWDLSLLDGQILFDERRWSDLEDNQNL